MSAVFGFCVFPDSLLTDDGSITYKATSISEYPLLASVCYKCIIPYSTIWDESGAPACLFWQIWLAANLHPFSNRFAAPPFGRLGRLGICDAVEVEVSGWVDIWLGND